MRLCSFQRADRRAVGAMLEDGVVDLSAHGGETFASMRALLAARDGLARARDLAARARADFPLDAVTLLPVVPDPERILCAGINYPEHREETGRTETAHPTFFTRFASTLVGHRQPLVRPRESREFDYEAELAVVIGRRCRRVALEQALDVVAGYSCFNDATARDWQRHSSQFTAGKNFPHTGALGPWLVTSDELRDPHDLTLRLRLNGKELQRTTTDELIFDVRALIAYASTFTELSPGDIIATGTPGGVGSRRTPPVFLQPGDLVEVELERVGVLRNTVVAES